MSPTSRTKPPARAASDLTSLSGSDSKKLHNRGCMCAGEHKTFVGCFQDIFRRISTRGRIVNLGMRVVSCRVVLCCVKLFEFALFWPVSVFTHIWC